MRGQALSADERALLGRWYSGQDRAESQLLGGDSRDEAGGRLQELLSEVLATIADVSTHMAEIVTENDSIRRDSAALRRRIARRSTSEPS
jgi:hypothetical protein